MGGGGGRRGQKERARVGMCVCVPIEVSLQDSPRAQLYSRSSSNQHQPRWGYESRVGIRLMRWAGCENLVQGAEPVTIAVTDGFTSTCAAGRPACAYATHSMHITTTQQQGQGARALGNTKT